MIKRRPIFIFLESLFIFVDILINIATGGAVGETISSRTGKQSLLHVVFARKFEKFVNWLFIRSWIPLSWRGPHHCYNSIDWEVGMNRHEMATILYKKWVETKDIKYAQSLNLIGITLYEMQY